MSVSSSYLVYSRLKPSLVSVLISVLISVSISVPISFRGQTRYGLGLISKKPSSFKKKPSLFKKKPSFFQVKTEVKTKDHSVFYAGSWSDIPSQLTIDHDLSLHHLEIDISDRNSKFFCTFGHSVIQARFPLDLI